MLGAAGLAVLLPAVLLVAPLANAAPDLPAFDAVDPWIGTELDTTENKSNDAYGNTFPGATVPFGLVQSSPTTYREGANGEKGGYEYTADRIRGFGMTRLSGTGCTGNYGGFDFPVLPFTGAAADGALPTDPATSIRDYYLPFRHADEVGEPGYYKVTTANAVTTELTATTRTAVSRFDFPADGSATLLLDVSGSNNAVAASSVRIDADARRVTGSVTAAAVCNQGKDYTVHFAATFDQPFTSHGVWDDGAVTVGADAATGGRTKHGTGAFLGFAHGSTVTARVGLSFTSVENAELNRAQEAGGRSFDEVRAAARTTWTEALGAVDVTGGTADERTKLYTALYHALHHPNTFDDVNGEYVGYDGTVRRVEPGRHFYVNFQGWDFYRGHAQLLAMAYPRVAEDVAGSIVGMAQQTGTWYDGPTYNLVQARMAADSLPIALASMDDFGITGYDRAGALASLLATQTLPGTRSTRPDAYQYMATGMIENTKGNFATARVLEYAVEDFAIAQLAGRLGDTDAQARFMQRAQSWRNVVDPETRHVRPRSRNGFDRAFDLRGRDGAGGGQFNQATGYQYGWMVPHNIGGLVAARGGVEASEVALDVLMEQLDAGAYTQTGNYLSNQPTLNSPWVYHWLGAPGKTTDVLRRAVDLYDTTPAGIPGNDDLGSLSAWYVWANLGLYPAVYGTADMLVSAPMFPQVTIDAVDSDRVYRVNAPALGGGARYVTGMTVDGVARSASWVGADFARRGGTIDLTLGATPGTWGTGEQDLPPSHDQGSDDRNNVGTTPDGQGGLGSMDLSDWSLSREALADAGAAPGARLPLGDTGLAFTWPDVAPGRPDNWIVAGQRLDVAGGRAEAISFLGLSTNGPATGTAVVEYTDGTRQEVPVTLTDWAQQPTAGNRVLVETGRRNHRSGSTGTGTFRVFATEPVALDPTKVVDAVVLPQGTDRGIMHVVDVALRALPDGPGSAEQVLQVTVPQQGGGEPGELVWAVDGTNGLVDLGTAEDRGDHRAATGAIHPVRVTDTRAAGPVWSVSAQVSDFTRDGASFAGKHLGWTPRLVEAGGGAVAGDRVRSGFDGGDGLSASSVLGRADAGHAPGSARLGADLELKIPVDVPDGTYRATLTLTALS